MLRRAKSRPGSRQRHKAMITPDLDGNATSSLILGKIGVHASMPSADGPKPEQAEALRGPKVESPACWARALSFADETSPGNPLWVFRTLSPHPACELACPGPKWLRRRGVIGRGPVSELRGVAAGFGRSARRRPPDATASRARKQQTAACLGLFANLLYRIQTWQHSVLWRMQGACFGTRSGMEPTTRDAPRGRVHHSCKSAECRVFCAVQKTIRLSVTPNLRFEARTAGVFPRHLARLQWNVQHTAASGQRHVPQKEQSRRQPESAAGPHSQSQATVTN